MMNSEFLSAPTAVSTQLGIAPIAKAHTEEEVGISIQDLSNLLNYVTSSNAHTHPPPKAKRVDPISTFSSNHLNVFLRIYLACQSKLSEGVVKDIGKFCRMNDCNWVHRCQQLSMQTLCNDLEARAAKRDFSQHLDVDAPVVLPQLRANLPWLKNNSEVPKFSCSSTNFKHIVGLSSNGATSSEDAFVEKDKFFSSQVKIKNDGKKGSVFDIRISERLSFYDGQLVAHTHSSSSTAESPTKASSSGSMTGGVESHPTNHAACEDIDFQVLLDRSTVKKGEEATILLSMIAKPSAMFSDILELIVLSIDDGIKIVVSFGVVNPFLPLFGSTFPTCIAQTVKGSPLGEYQAPAVLQMLKHKFILNQGLANRDLHSLIYFSHTANPQINKKSLIESMNLKEELDDGADIFAVIASTAEIGKKQMKEEQAAITTIMSPQPKNEIIAGVDDDAMGSGSPVPKSSLCSLSTFLDEKHGGIAGSPAQPQGMAVGALVPSGKATAAVAVSAHSNRFPKCLEGADPLSLFTLILLWIAEFPTPIVDAGITQCDAFVFVGTLEPCLQGIVWWVVDFCCALLLHSDYNGVSLRGLANCFASVLVRDEHVVADENAVKNTAHKRAVEGGAALSNIHHATESTGDEDDEQKTTFTQAAQIRLHTVTALVKLISKYKVRYEAAAKANRR